METNPIKAVEIPMALEEQLAVSFDLLYRDKLVPMADGSGHGGEGYKQGWIHGLSMIRIPSAELEGIFKNAISYLRQDQTHLLDAKIFQIIFNRLEPGADLGEHIDGPPYNERWHLPIISDGATYYQKDAVRIGNAGLQGNRMYQGFWYGPISYWVPHSMENATNYERIHMIVDFKTGPDIAELKRNLGASLKAAVNA